ncbi:MAG TPA: chaperone modulator CbpM [Steroidobacteraceae bacterium]|jgi:chaperone modulatory protein CbpM
MATGIRTIETQVVAEGEWLSVTQVCRASQIDVAVVIELAELGLVCPRGTAPQDWQVSARELVRLRTAARLIRDLGVNVSGAALAVELLEARRELETRLRVLERCVQASTIGE